MGNEKKIIIVDDDLVAQRILSVRLEINGYSVIIAQDGEEAIEKTKKEKPDLMVLDLMIPKMNGYEVCRMLKFDDNYKDMPIIILSALHLQQDRDKAVESGADACFLKPFDLDLFLTKVESLIGRH